MTFAGMQRADADDLPRDFLAALVRDRHHDTIFAEFVHAHMLDRPVEAHGRDRRGLRLGDGGIETQMMLAARANIGAHQHGRLAMRTDPRCADRTLTSDIHCYLPSPLPNLASLPPILTSMAPNLASLLPNLASPAPILPAPAPAAFSSSQPNSTCPRMREPAATVIEPALTSPTMTPRSSTWRRLAEPMLPCNSPPTTTMAASTWPVRCAPASMLKFPSIRTSPLKRPAIRTLPDPSIFPSIDRLAAITDSPTSARAAGRRDVFAAPASIDMRSGVAGAAGGIAVPAPAGVIVSFQSAMRFFSRDRS